MSEKELDQADYIYKHGGDPRPTPDAPPDRLMCNCRGCGKRIIWTGVYGDWCHECRSRDTAPTKRAKR